MRTQKKPEAADAAKAQPGTTFPEHQKSIVSLHRAWLVALAALIIVPWLIAGAIYTWRSAGAAAPDPAAPRAVATAMAAPGPWGRLTITPIVISPPLEYVAADWGRSGGRAEWYFPGTPVEAMEAFLAWAGLSREQVNSIVATRRPDPTNKGLIVKPDPEMVRNFSPEVRARLYLQLGKTPLNFDQANAFRFHGSSAEEWFRHSAISEATKKLIAPLVYRDGEFLVFADSELARSLIKDPEELHRLAKVLLRQSTVMVKLSVRDDADTAALAEYWGRGGRRTDLRPLLESVAGRSEANSIDIVHLLPTFARNHLYRYPRLTAADLDKPLLSNCLWSALNFFSAQPDDRFLDVKTALNTLRRDYYIVEHGFQLGDVVAFLDERGNLFHVASYLADGMVLSKNGTSPVAPWAITTVEQLKNYYRTHSANPQLIYHRRNDL